MIDLQAYLEPKLRGIISAWHADDIYAISFFVCANEAYEYNGVSNVTEFSVGYQQSTIAVVRVSSPRNAGITPFGGRRKRL